MCKNLTNNSGFSVFSTSSFTVICRRYSLPEVPQRRIHNAIALAMSFNTPHSALKRHSLPQGARECGRSMIEMLGVLTIIAVLSVGGIAGYGKAMRMWNSNLQKEQLTQLFQSLIRLRYDLSHDRQYNEQQGNVSAILYALGEVPTGMRYNGNLYDKTGNGYTISYGHGCWQTRKDSDEQTCSFSLGFTVTLRKTDSSLAPSSEDLCVNIVNVAKENADDVRGITTFLGNKDKNDEENWRGYAQKLEFNQSTLRTATPMQILQMCRKCKDQPYCRVNVSIYVN